MHIAKASYQAQDQIWKQVWDELKLHMTIQVRAQIIEQTYSSVALKTPALFQVISEDIKHE